MAVLGWIALGLATAVMRSSFRRGDERRDGLAASCAIAVVGSELASNPRGRREITGPRSRPWAGHAGVESEPLDRNW
jgi:hypothetical protein